MAARKDPYLNRNSTNSKWYWDDPFWRREAPPEGIFFLSSIAASRFHPRFAAIVALLQAALRAAGSPKHPSKKSAEASSLFGGSKSSVFSVKVGFLVYPLAARSAARPSKYPCKDHYDIIPSSQVHLRIWSRFGCSFCLPAALRAANSANTTHLRNRSNGSFGDSDPQPC